MFGNKAVTTKSFDSPLKICQVDSSDKILCILPSGTKSSRLIVEMVEVQAKRRLLHW